jgi:transposase InsO family protein
MGLRAGKLLVLLLCAAGAVAPSSCARGNLSTTQNAFIESFNGKFRDECLNETTFASLQEAREIIEAWRNDYNGLRPHRSLGQLTPNEFANTQPICTSYSTYN